ncbi:hypothetical protein G7046_g185 [Stylonectria norvegica]|nr:hypothetical protein G7046_g185 [Stylonectria norvegica]
MAPIATNGSPETPAGGSNFRPGIKVAVIGAGVSGICTAAHLLNNGADVTVFERSGVSSGVWHYDERTTNSPTFPSEKASVGDYETSLPGQFSEGIERPTTNGLKSQHSLNTTDGKDLEIAFAPPGPCYAGLKNNVPTTLLYSSLGPWPQGTEAITGHINIERYLQGLSAQNGVDDITQFHTRVEHAEKSQDGTSWTLRTISLQPQSQTEVPRVVEKTWQFDALVIASGHYNLPRVPSIPGLAEWKRLFGDRIIHSKQYRQASTYLDKNILIIGGGTSALDVCRETDGIAKGIVQSTRGGDFDLPSSLLPQSAERVGGVDRLITDPNVSARGNLKPSEPIPGKIYLKDGRVLEGIDNIIVATGYITSYPFLSQYHSDDLTVDTANSEILVTAEGNMVHNLHKDIFYIEDTSLAFIGVPYYISTFSLFDHQAQVLARVFTGKSRLPDRDNLRDEYQMRVSAKGLGRQFHSLVDEGAEIAYVKDIVDSVNGGVVDENIEPLKAHSPEWLQSFKEFRKAIGALRLGKDDKSKIPTWP